MVEVVAREDVYTANTALLTFKGRQKCPTCRDYHGTHPIKKKKKNKTLGVADDVGLREWFCRCRFFIKKLDECRPQPIN